MTMRHDERTYARIRAKFFGAVLIVGLILSAAIAALFAKSTEPFMIENYGLITGVAIAAFWLAYIGLVCGFIVSIKEP